MPVAVRPDVKGTLVPLLAPEKAGLPPVALALGVTVELPGLSTLLRGKKGRKEELSVTVS